MGRAPIAVLVSLLGAAGGAMAAEPVVVPPAARTAIALTIYSQDDLAIVRETREAAVPAGIAVVRFPGLPERVDPRTLRLEGGERDALAVREQSFRWDGDSAERLLAQWVGKPVELVETDEDLRTRTTTAVLISPGPPPVYRVEDRLLLGHPGRVQLPATGADVVLEPTASWTIESGAAGRRTLTASYQTGGLGWEADYALALASDAGPRVPARLAAWVTLRNGTRGAFAGAEVALVAGRVHRAREPVPRGEAMGAKVAMLRAQAAPAEEPLAGYHRYALPDRVTLAAFETKQVPLFVPPLATSVERRYRVTGPGLWIGPVHDEDEQTLPVESRLRLENTARMGLGRPLPAGIVRVEAPAPSGASEFVGEDRIGHLAEDETADLQIGEASDLVAKRRVVEYRETGTKPYEIEAAVRLVLRNHTKAPVLIEVREPLGRTWRLVESSHEATPVDATTLGMSVPVPARGTTEATYRVQLGR